MEILDKYEMLPNHQVSFTTEIFMTTEHIAGLVVNYGISNTMVLEIS